VGDVVDITPGGFRPGDTAYVGDVRLTLKRGVMTRQGVVWYVRNRGSLARFVHEGWLRKHPLRERPKLRAVDDNWEPTEPERRVIRFILPPPAEAL
jgi:hypothetical protein